MFTNFLRIIIFVNAIFLFNNAFAKSSFTNKQNFSSNNTVAFTENKGQMTDVFNKPVDFVLFKAETPGINIWITTSGLTYQFLEYEKIPSKSFDETRMKNEKYIGWHRVDMILKNATIKKENIIKENESQQGVENFYLGHCPQGIFNVKSYSKIIIKEVYKGIDWVLYTNNEFSGSSLKYDFIVHPSADPNQIKLIYEGSGKFEIKNNRIAFENNIGRIQEGKLFCYQQEHEIKSKYIAKKVDNRQEIIYNTSPHETLNLKPETFSYEVNIQLWKYDKLKTLIIDPQLVWSTFYGGNAADGSMSITCDANGDVFIASYIHSTNYPTLNPGAGAYYQAAMGGPLSVANVSIVRFNNNGQRLWATYYGGDGHDVGSSVSIDNAGNIYVTGYAQSSNFPTQNLAGAYNQAATAGHYDAFIIKFNTAGLRQWATMYGGANGEYPNSMCIDNVGNIYITGHTVSPSFPVVPLAGAYNQPIIAGGLDGFILKFTNTGAVVWSTFVGGIGTDIPYAICSDAAGNIFVTGETGDASFPVLNTGGAQYFQAYGGGNREAFILKYLATGAMSWGTFYGGSVDDMGFSIACDHNSDVYVLGQTNSVNVPLLNLPGAYNQNVFSGDDALLLKFSNTGTRLWASLYGGTGTEFPSSYDNIAVDNCNNVYFSFTTTSTDIPVKNYTSCNTQFFDATLTGKSDCFFTKFNSSCNLLWGTYWGGDGGDFREAMGVDTNDNLFITGEWAENNITPATYPILNPGGNAFYSNAHMGSDDSYIAKFSPPTLTFTQSQINNTLCNPCNGSASISLACGNANYSYVWSNSSQSLNDTNNINTITGLCAGTYTVTATANCNKTVTATFTITGPSTVFSTQSPSICTGSSFTLPGGNSVNTSGIYNDTLTSSNGCDSIITTNLTVANTINIAQNITICAGQTFTLPSGGSVSSAGVYNDTLLAVGGCDSIITTTLTISPASIFNQTVSICNGQSYSLPGGGSVNLTGNYSDTIQTSQGCDSIVNTNLTVVAAITSTQNISICNGQTHTLPGGTIVSAAGNYLDTLTAQGGCDSIITTNLIVKPTSASLQNPVICLGESHSLPDGTIVATTGTYTTTLVAANGCDSIVTTNLTVNPIPVISISPDIAIIQGDSTILTASGGSNYNWNPSSGLTNTTGATVVASPNQTTTYCVIVANSFGCIDSACLTVSVELPCPLAENLALPNAFSPNNDGVNDEFCLQGWDVCIEKFSIIIYDRWGEKVFVSDNPSFCWDGTYKEKKMDSQVVVYYVKATYLNTDKAIIKNGNISLLR